MSNHHIPHHLKRLQHDKNSNLHLSSSNHHSYDNHSRVLNDEVLRESMQNFTVSSDNNDQTNFSQPSRPGLQRARRGGGGGGVGGRFRHGHGHSSKLLPKRAINYDLAESFMDHSTNPLSCDLYKIKFKHSAKQWPKGRFINYKEKLDKLDGNIIDISCTRICPIVATRKKVQEANKNAKPIISTTTTAATTTTTTTPLALLNPVVQEPKKKLIGPQSIVYANLFGGGKIPRISSKNQIIKPTSTMNSTSSSTAISLLDQNITDH
ncbi:unnamed protein product [Adineta steineri]|uniref:Uncharacterized protein n=1 Tax=Adineta steineri TaxID=433720 RepID=A0A815GFN1_9BILA|nr:unnamed protein product [Adineta steineri]CAF3583202.1 unnamed protein product [Adineta steineri]